MSSFAEQQAQVLEHYQKLHDQKVKQSGKRPFSSNDQATYYGNTGTRQSHGQTQQQQQKASGSAYNYYSPPTKARNLNLKPTHGVTPGNKANHNNDFYNYTYQNQMHRDDSASDDSFDDARQAPLSYYNSRAETRSRSPEVPSIKIINPTPKSSLSRSPPTGRKISRSATFSGGVRPNLNPQVSNKKSEAFEYLKPYKITSLKEHYEIEIAIPYQFMDDIRVFSIPAKKEALIQAKVRDVQEYTYRATTPLEDRFFRLPLPYNITWRPDPQFKFWFTNGYLTIILPKVNSSKPYYQPQQRSKNEFESSYKKAPNNINGNSYKPNGSDPKRNSWGYSGEQKPANYYPYGKTTTPMPQGRAESYEGTDPSFYDDDSFQLESDYHVPSRNPQSYSRTNPKW